ncbi:hypothetical protein I552_8015 [Mycobacterium xenopi 3993]|nr:hypothetical protein I552_8015 [Mycobacterium xenopi 3993]
MMRAPAPPIGPLTQGRSRNLEKDFDRNYVHSLDWRWLTPPSTTGRGHRGSGRPWTSSRARR